MEQNLIQHAPQHIAITGIGDCNFHCFGNCAAERSGRARVLCKDFAADLCCFGRGRNDRGSVGAHHLTAEGLLLIADLDHINFAIQPKVRTGHGKRCAPLAGAGFRCDTFQPLILSIICLCDGGVQFMAAAGIIAFKLVVDFCRCLKLFFQAVCTDERRRTIHFVKITNFLGDLDVRGLIIQFLANKFLAEHTAQFFGGHRLESAGIQQRGRLVFHVRTDIVPALGHLVFFKVNFVRDFLFF